MNNKYILKNNIAAFRKMHDLSQSDLAKLVGLSKNAISAFERGVYLPSAYTAALLCEIFCVSFEQLFYLE